MLMMRTPYLIGPYGEDKLPDPPRGNPGMIKEGIILVFQDVRGRGKSEGTFVNMTPHFAGKRSPKDIDESSDTFDTVDWLVKNVAGNNGRVGQWGISYPGFYAAAGAIDAHPALKAASPQAPIADWFFDDFFHHGAFFLPHAFNFTVSFGRPGTGLPVPGREPFRHGTPDGYQFFHDLGPLSNARRLMSDNRMWEELVAHPNRDEFWQKRDILPHLNRMAPAMLTVGGWFDAEDLYGPLKIYRSIEAKNPSVANRIVMGPWSHGGWHRGDGSKLGHIPFGANTGEHYRMKIEKPFFDFHLRGIGTDALPEASMFETGANRWRAFDVWPPKGTTPRSLRFESGGALRLADAAGELPSEGADADEFISDPAKPVPFTEVTDVGMTTEYMTDDQRFAARRPDVLHYQTGPLDRDVTIAGPLLADLLVSTSAHDADWVVKLVDVLPPDTPTPPGNASWKKLGDYQMLVRSEVIRGRFRDGYEKPKPFEPNQPTRVKLELLDVLHTFKKGHRIAIQVQSTWFPLVDRNPQGWVDNIFEARASDFRRATHKLHRAGSAIRFEELP
jgi:hypothetical protein